MGDYDVTIPEDVMSGYYRIRVGVFEDDEVFDCSEPFDIINDDEPMDEMMSLSMVFTDMDF